MISPRPIFGRYITAAAVAVLLFLGRGVFAEVPVVVMGQGLGITNDADLYTGSDGPHGVYQIHTMPVGGTRTNVVQLGETLSAGTYRFLLSGIEYDRALGADMHVRVTAGGGPVSLVYLNDRDAPGAPDNRYWSTNHELVASGSFSSLTFVWTNSHPSLTWTPMFLGFWLGDDATANRDPDRDDVISTYQWPTETNATITFSGNLQRNGGFEAGLGSEWLAVEPGGFRSFSMQSMLTTNAYEGAFALMAPKEVRLYSPPFELQPGRATTLSLRMFGFAGASSDTIALLSPVQDVPDGASNTVVIQGPFNTAGASWKLIQATGYALPYPNNRAVYQWHIHMRGTSTVDNIQIREGAVDASVYAERTALALGHALSDSVFTSTPSFPLVIHNASGDALAGRVQWEVRDAPNRLIASGTVSQTFPAGNTTNVLNPGVTRWGWYRLTAWAVGLDGSRFEKPFCYVSGIENDWLANHSGGQRWIQDQLRKAGSTHVRAMSANQAFRWATVNPSDGVWVFDDDSVNNTLDAGNSILGVLGEPSAKAPSWVGSTVDATWIGHWTNYVQTIAGRYPDVIDWELGNEPNSGGSFGSDYAGYTNMWISGWHALTNANPNARLVAFGGAQLSWVNSVIAIFPDWRDYCHAVSTHLYSDPMEVVSGGDTGGRAAEWQVFAATHGVEVYNTEAGAWDQARWWSGSTGTPVWSYQQADTWVDPHLSTPISHQKNVLLSLGHGISRYYIYDSRLPVVADVFGVHTTILAPDDSFSPKGVAVLALGGFLGPGLGDISADPATIAMLFGGDSPVVALWRTNNGRYELEMPDPVVIHDTYGNPTDTNVFVQLGRAPVFIGGLPLGDLTNAVAAATGADATDEDPPNVSIEEWPIRPFSHPGERVRLRGLAVDEQDVRWKTSPDDVESSLANRWQIVGVDSDWREWTFENELVIDEWPAAATAIRFEARDASGNVGFTERDLLGGGTAVIRNAVLRNATLR